MTTPTGKDDLVRRMLLRRADGWPPEWLLPGVTQAVHATPHARAGLARASWLPRRRSERLILVAASAVLLLGLVVGAIVAAGMIVQSPKLSLPATVVVPSASTTPSPGQASARPGGSETPPRPVATTSPADAVAAAWALPPGWRYQLDCDDDGTSCALALYDDAGRIQDGWPVLVGGSCEGGPVAIGPDSSAFVACTRGGRAVVTGLDRNGNALPGWPASVKGTVAAGLWNDFKYGSGWPSIAVGPDQTVYVAVHPAEDRKYVVHALAPDGEERRGWPVTIDGDGQGFAIAPDGTVVAWTYEGWSESIQIEARRTVFTEFESDGRVRAGWPRGSTGAASGPVVWEDGSLAYVSASGKAWAHDRTGEIITGWPFDLSFAAAPTLRADGTIIFVGDSRVDVVDRHGKAVTGWPYRSKGTFLANGCDTPSFPTPLATTGPDGTLYLGSSHDDRSTIVALDPEGAVVDGWPYEIPTGWRVFGLYLSDGMVAVSVAGDPCGDGADARPIRLTLQGSLVGDALPTPLNGVYDAMRLEGLRTTSGQTSFASGAQIDFGVALVNRSARGVTLPRVNDQDPSRYAAGSLQTWLEPVVAGPPLWYCLPNPSQGNERYATGGEVLIAVEPITISPGGTMPSLLHASLPPETTACLPPGQYRYRVDYERYGVAVDDVMNDQDAIDVATIQFTITGSAPAVAPAVAPTPIPSPWPSAPRPEVTPPPTASDGPAPSPS